MFSVVSDEFKLKSSLKQRPDANPFHGFNDESDTAQTLDALDKSLMNLFDCIPPLFSKKASNNKKSFDLTQKLSENL
jgi:hypothetical protein